MSIDRQAIEGGLRSRRRWVAIGLIVVIVAAVTAGYGLAAGTQPEVATPATPAAATVAVERRDLQQSIDIQGTLGFGDARDVVGGLAGVVTAVPEVGSLVQSGQPLYWVDDQPVVLMDGTTPAWRTLRSGVSDGPDVAQLERSLVNLGFATEPELTVDEEWTWRTTEAVEKWQASLGLEETGYIEQGRVVFLPGARRVASASIAVGAQAMPGSSVLSTTSESRTITADLDARRQHSVQAGMTVSVTLPDGSKTDATIVRVGTVAKTAAEGEKPTVELTLELVDPSATGNLDGATVGVTIPTETAEGVLAVPVTALLATAADGYVVEVQKEGSTKTVAVTVGMFADGWVEIADGDLVEGDSVVVPS